MDDEMWKAIKYTRDHTLVTRTKPSISCGSEHIRTNGSRALRLVKGNRATVRRGSPAAAAWLGADIIPAQDGHDFKEDHQRRVERVKVVAEVVFLGVVRADERGVVGPHEAGPDLHANDGVHVVQQLQSLARARPRPHGDWARLAVSRCTASIQRAATPTYAQHHDVDQEGRDHLDHRVHDAVVAGGRATDSTPRARGAVSGTRRGIVAPGQGGDAQ